MKGEMFMKLKRFFACLLILTAITMSLVSCGSSDDTKKTETTKQTKVEQTPINGELKVHFIDVGQGDATFIELPNDKTMLIDAGPSDREVTDYIKSNGYDSIDYVIATHPDADHINGMPEILNTFKVGTFYMPEKEHTTAIFEKTLDSITENGCKTKYAVAGKNIIDKDELKIYFVGPVEKYNDNNACSAVVKLEYKQTSFLFTGDADHTSESDMLKGNYDLSADILKVGHHGSSSSSSVEFINAVRPKDAIISVGANSYGHPTDEVLNILSNVGASIYRTDDVGTITVTSDGAIYTIDKASSPINPPIEETNDSAQDNTQGNAQEDTTTVTVYITRTGTKYHSAGCSYLKSSSIEITLDEAKADGLTPCSRCNPPE